MQFPLVLPFGWWIWILMGYIFIASITPVWILLQPRDYLNSFLLYALLIGAFAGIVLTGPSIEFSAFRGFRQEIGLLFPILFVTVACGAISGFHSLVASGTTSKQLNREKDARPVGYGGMLIESLLAVIALITVARLSGVEYQQVLAQKGPVELFAEGVGRFLTVFSIPEHLGMVLTALTVSAFALTSLDTGTRLARLSFQELIKPGEGISGGLLSNRFTATFLSVAAGGTLALTGEWRSIWPVFGAANQLLAALALLAVTLWLKSRRTTRWFVQIPMIIMFVITLTALIMLIHQNLSEGNFILAGCALLLLGVAVSMIVQVARRKKTGDRRQETGTTHH
jgi:carbon starvation protein